MRRDVITLRHVDAAHAALFLGAALAGAGALAHEVIASVVGVVMVLGACVVAAIETERESRIETAPAPRNRKRGAL